MSDAETFGEDFLMVRSMLEDVLGCSLVGFGVDANLVDDVGLDSLAVAELSLRLADRGLTIDESALDPEMELGDVVNALRR